MVLVVNVAALGGGYNVFPMHISRIDILVVGIKITSLSSQLGNIRPANLEARNSEGLEATADAIWSGSNRQLIRV